MLCEADYGPHEVNELAYTPTHIKPWIEQINYTGEDFSEYYVASWRFFRCSPVEKSNHEYIREHLLDSVIVNEKVVITPTFSDEVMGFRYYVMVHREADRSLRMADMFAKRIAAKGSLDPENEVKVDRKSIHYSWGQFSLLAKVNMCKEAGVTIFAARNKKFPRQHAAKLYAHMTEI